MKRALFLAASTLIAAAVPLGAQDYRTLVETRRLDGSGPLSVNVSFGVGELVVRPADGKQLYRVALTYAEDRFEPEVRYNPATHSLRVGVEGRRHRDVRDVDDSRQQLDLALAREVPVDLDLAFGALHATVELGDMTLRSAHLKTGASETTVSFASPTRGACERLDFELGAAQFEALRLGNSRCRAITLKGAVGEVELDFSGDLLPGETQVALKVALGEVRLRIPERVGVRLTADRFLATVARAGLERRGSAFVSPGYDGAATKLVIDVDAALGSVEIERIR